MSLTTCSSSKSPDLSIWKCSSCKKFRNIRSESVLAGSKLSFKTFLSLIFYFSIRSLSNVEVAALTGLSDKTVGDWRTLLSNAVADWFLRNSQPLGGPGVVVEIDEAKFGKYLTEMMVIDQQAFDVMKNEALSEKKTQDTGCPQQALQGEDSYVSLQSCGETTYLIG